MKLQPDSKTLHRQHIALHAKRGFKISIDRSYKGDNRLRNFVAGEIIFYKLKAFFNALRFIIKIFIKQFSRILQRHIIMDEHSDTLCLPVAGEEDVFAYQVFAVYF